MWSEVGPKKEPKTDRKRLLTRHSRFGASECLLFRWLASNDAIDEDPFVCILERVEVLIVSIVFEPLKLWLLRGDEPPFEYSIWWIGELLEDWSIKSIGSEKSNTRITSGRWWHAHRTHTRIYQMEDIWPCQVTNWIQREIEPFAHGWLTGLADWEFQWVCLVQGNTHAKRATLSLLT